MSTRYTFAPLATALLFSGSLLAQNQVDIGLFHNAEGQLEVKVRPQADFSGIFSALVFTLRWDRNSNTSLGEAVQEDAAGNYMPIFPSGGVHENGPYRYQIFTGFGFQSIASSGMTWQAGKEYTIAKIPVVGAAEFHLVNDAWTNELKNNGDYYLSLGGVDRTGTIYKSLAAPSTLESTLMIQPNPNDGRFTFSFLSTETSDIRVEVLNTLGQRIFGDVLRDFQGTYRKEMDISNMSNGIYYLKLSRGGENSVHKIVYR